MRSKSVGEFAAMAASVVVLGLTACSDSSVRTEAGSPQGSNPVSLAADLGACPEEFREAIAGKDGEHIDRGPFYPLLTDPALTWVEVGGVEAREGPTTSTRLDERVGVNLRTPQIFDGNPSQTSEAVYVSSDLLNGLDQASEVPGRLIVAVDGEVLKTGVLLTDNETIFVGPCEYELATLPFASFVATQVGRSAPEIFTAIVTDPTGDDAQALVTWDGDAPTDQDWLDRPADQRSIDPDETPADLLADLDTVSVEVAVPGDWRSNHHLAFCTRTELAWGECVGFDVASEMADDPLASTGYVRDGEALALWLVRQPPEPTRRVGLVTTLAPSQVARAVAGDQVIRVSIRAAYRDLDSFVAAINAGEQTVDVMIAGQ